MDFEKLDPDYLARLRAYTQTIHRDLYPSIDPKSPALSQRGKVVIITGASSGLGATGFAPAFAQAGARAIVLVGRRHDKLVEVGSSLRKDYPSVEFLEVAMSVSEPESVDTLFETVKEKFGSAEVLINNAGVMSGPSEIMSSDPATWWSDFETNTHGTYLVTRGYLNLLGSSKRGTIINVSSGAATSTIPKMSSYGLSKVVLNKLSDFVSAECENVSCVALDPGAVNTDMMFDMMRKFALDTPALSGGIAVWLSTEQAEFLRGCSVMANWSVDELLEKKDHIMASGDLKMTLQGKFGI